MHSSRSRYMHEITVKPSRLRARKSLCQLRLRVILRRIAAVNTSNLSEKIGQALDTLPDRL